METSNNPENKELNEQSEQQVEVVDRAEQQRRRNEQMKLQREKHIQRIKEHYVEVLMSQTTWSEEEAKQQLEENNFNVMECVRKFMGIPNKKANEDESQTRTTINQGIYKNIRSMMDEASYRYEKRKEMEERLQAIRDSYSQRQSQGQTNVED
jgi:hypothetical protein